MDVLRALADHALAQDAEQPLLHSLSTAIEKNKAAYYDHLEQAQKGGLDISEWVAWFIDITFQALEITERTIAWTVQKADFLKQLAGEGRNTRYGLNMGESDFFSLS